jgi:hypothetical protein
MKWFLYSFLVISIPFPRCLRSTLLYVFRTKPVSAPNSEPLHLTLQAKLVTSDAVLLTKESPRFLALVDNLTARSFDVVRHQRSWLRTYHLGRCKNDLTDP